MLTESIPTSPPSTKLSSVLDLMLSHKSTSLDNGFKLSNKPEHLLWTSPRYVVFGLLPFGGITPMATQSIGDVVEGYRVKRNGMH